MIYSLIQPKTPNSSRKRFQQLKKMNILLKKHFHTWIQNVKKCSRFCQMFHSRRIKSYFSGCLTSRHQLSLESADPETEMATRRLFWWTVHMTGRVTEGTKDKDYECSPQSNLRIPSQARILMVTRTEESAAPQEGKWEQTAKGKTRNLDWPRMEKEFQMLQCASKDITEAALGSSTAGAGSENV